MIYNFYQDSTNGICGVSVISGGHIFAKNGRKIDRPQGREDYLLFYIARGKECFFLENESVANEGSFIIFKPHEKQQHVYLEDKTGEFYYVHFNAPEGFDLFGFESSRIYSSTPDSTVSDLFEQIISELQQKQPAYEKFCTAKLFMLLSVLERKTKSESGNSLKNFDEISYVIQNMNKEYYMNYTLDDYAKMCNMSKYHFLRVFESITGKAPLEYRSSIRLDHTKVQLRDTNIPIAKIAENAGYSSPAYFSIAFKKEFGISPSEFRKKETD